MAGRSYPLFVGTNDETRESLRQNQGSSEETFQGRSQANRRPPACATQAANTLPYLRNRLLTGQE